jgi:hypothetical protein
MLIWDSLMMIVTLAQRRGIVTLTQRMVILECLRRIVTFAH